jgi:hypothetical protein
MNRSVPPLPSEPLTALPVEADEVLDPILILSVDDMVSPGQKGEAAEWEVNAKRQAGAPSGEPILDALPVLPPIPELILDPLPVHQPLTLWRLIRGVYLGIYSAIEWVFGAIALVIGLAFLAAIPIVGFLSLGYLLETGGRIARNAPARAAWVRQRYRRRITRFFMSGLLALGDGVVGVRKAARVGSIVLGVGLMIVPLQIVSSLHVSAQIVDPAGPAAGFWRAVLSCLAVAAFLHIVLACLHGGRFHHFLWPIGNLIWLIRRLPSGRFYTEPRDALWAFVSSLRLPYYFWLGARGFIGALAWLVIPISMMALGLVVPPLGLLGAGWFGMLLLVLPILQMHFAAQNRFRASFELIEVFRRFIRAPWAFAFAQFVALLLSLPPYLFKIEFIPREVGGIPSLFFVLVSLIFIVFIYPTRLVAGWAYGRSVLRARPCHWFFSVTAVLAMIPGTALYVLLVFLTQYVSWKGAASLYEQHTFLLPVPF